MRSNTFEKGRVRTLVFNDGGNWYGVALEFNLVIDASTQEEATAMLQSCIRDYLSVAVETDNLDAINQTPDPEYLKLWKAEHSSPRRFKIRKPIRQVSVLSSGVTNIGALISA